jgi:nucleoside-diphosphate-sugar epimerase
MARSAHRGALVLIAVTGASGYVGAHCVAEAMKRGERVVAFSTQPAKTALVARRDQLIWQFAGDYHALNLADWAQRLAGVETIIHCAARVHQTSAEATQSMRRDNTQLTEIVARAAAEAGVRRFVFLSSAAVFGDAVNAPEFSTIAQLNGASAYALSKIEAEYKLIEVADSLGVAVDIFRPPIVYGVGAPGNLSRLARMVAKGWPLPFGAIHNRRSIVSIRTLIASIFWSIERAEKSDSRLNIWHPTDRESVSTTAMVNAISRGLRRPTRNLAVPSPLLRFALNACGQRRMAQQLLDSWELDSSTLRAAGFSAFADSKIELELLGRALSTPGSSISKSMRD